MNEIQQQQSTQAIRAATICYMNYFEKSRENCPGSDSFTIKLQFYNVAGLCTIRAAGTAGSFIFLARYHMRLFHCDLCRQRGVELIEGHLMPDNILMCLSVPPNYSIAFVIGFLKGKSTVLIHRIVLGKKRVSEYHRNWFEAVHLNRKPNISRW